MKNAAHHPVDRMANWCVGGCRFTLTGTKHVWHSPQPPLRVNHGLTLVATKEGGVGVWFWYEVWSVELKHHHHLNGLQTDVEHNWAGVGWSGACVGELLSFLPIFCSLYWPSLEGHCFFFSFWFQIEQEVPSTELSCYGFQNARNEFLCTKAIFSFLWLLKTCPVVVEWMKKKNWFGKHQIIPPSRPPPTQIIFIEINYVCWMSMSGKIQFGNSA
jgi:hypothetical protein